jgi:hypothetical protein
MAFYFSILDILWPPIFSWPKFRFLEANLFLWILRTWQLDILALDLYRILNHDPDHLDHTNHPMIHDRLSLKEKENLLKNRFQILKQIFFNKCTMFIIN